MFAQPLTKCIFYIINNSTGHKNLFNCCIVVVLASLTDLQQQHISVISTDYYSFHFRSFNAVLNTRITLKIANLWKKQTKSNKHNLNYSFHNKGNYSGITLIGYSLLLINKA